MLYVYALDLSLFKSGLKQSGLKRFQTLYALNYSPLLCSKVIKLLCDRADDFFVFKPFDIFKDCNFLEFCLDANPLLFLRLKHEIFF